MILLEMQFPSSKFNQRVSKVFKLSPEAKAHFYIII